MMSSSGSQHAREGDEEEVESGSSWLKRFSQGLSPRAEQLINILEEEEGDCDERNGEEFVAEEEVLCGVMKCLEEEISNSSRGKGIRFPDLSNNKEISSSSRGQEVRSLDLSNKEISSSSRGEEIRSPDLSHMDEMSYLLRALDDELGIPPSPCVGGTLFCCGKEPGVGRVRCCL